MYRRYEDPHKLERLLEIKRMALDDAEDAGDLEEIIALSEDINDLEQRLAAAWEDDAAEVYGYE